MIKTTRSVLNLTAFVTTDTEPEEESLDILVNRFDPDSKHRISKKVFDTIKTTDPTKANRVRDYA
jgi:Zn-dependent M32 family carboxypeptidase